MDTIEQIKARYKNEAIQYLGSSLNKLGKLLLIATAAISTVYGVEIGVDAFSGDNSTALYLTENLLFRGGLSAAVGAAALLGGSRIESRATEKLAELPEHIEPGQINSYDVT